jgi:hypothetical protein
MNLNLYGLLVRRTEQWGAFPPYAVFWVSVVKLAAHCKTYKNFLAHFV